MKTNRWVVLVASCIVNLCIGSMYAWSVFVTPLANHFSELTGTEYTPASLSIVFTICNAYGFLPMMLGSYFQEKFGARLLIVMSGILYGAGMVISSFAIGIPTLIFGYSLLMGMGVGFAYGCTINNTVKFFPDKRGLIGGLATASYGFSSVIVPYVVNYLLPRTNISYTMRFIGILYGAIIIVGGLFIVSCPPDYVPKGYVAKAGNNSQKVADKNWRDLLIDPIYYILLILFTCGCFVGMMTISQVSPMAQSYAGFSLSDAAKVVSLLAFFNMGGRIAGGFVSDKIGRINTLTIMLVVALISMIILRSMGSAPVFFEAGVMMVGLAYGAFLGIFPSFTIEQFGAKNNTVNYAMVFIGMSFAALSAPTIASKIFTAYGSYQKAFIVGAIISFVGLILSLALIIFSDRTGTHT